MLEYYIKYINFSQMYYFDMTVIQCLKWKSRISFRYFRLTIPVADNKSWQDKREAC